MVLAKEYKELFNSVRENLKMKNYSFMPFYSLYFNIHS